MLSAKILEPGNIVSSIDQGLVVGLVHLMLSPEVILHQLFSQKAFAALGHGAIARTIFLQVDGGEMSLCIAQPGKLPAAHDALTSACLQFSDPIPN